jgi:hypothetical protein
MPALATALNLLEAPPVGAACVGVVSAGVVDVG